MKFPANPTKPYIRHNAQTLRVFRKSDQGVGSFVTGRTERPDAMRSHSAALTCGISSDRLRNHDQKKVHQTKPRPVRTHNGVVQLPKTFVISKTTSSGARAPPRRVNIQFVPWAKPRCRAGIQSAMTRAR